MNLIPLEDAPLPAPIQQKLTDLELRHKRHLQMLEDHHERKHRRREDHRNGIHRMRFPAGSLK